MVVPAVTAWMKKCDGLPGCRVWSLNGILLALIAVPTGKGQIIQVVGTAEGTRENMVYGKSTGAELFRVTTILAQTCSLRDNLGAYRL